MVKKRLIAFIAIVVLCLTAAGITSPHLVKNLRLGLDLKGGFEILYVATPVEEGAKVTKASLLETARNLQKRIDSQGIAEPEITTEGSDRIRVKLAGVTDEEKVRETLKKPSNLTFRGPDGKVELNGSDFVPGGASVEFNQAHQPYISIKLKSASKFAEITGRLVGQPLSIYLDEEVQASPVVNSVINSDTASIEGGYTYDSAKEMANIINLGALPLNLTEKYTQSVGATLGQQSLHQTVEAGLIGAALILLFMIFFYRLPGIVASITLITYLWIVIVVFYYMKATITLPGIAAMVLGVGMAVDANIITYERIKEEIRTGKSMLSALKSGAKHSFRTIVDANVTNAISCAVLYYIGNGAIRGFALTLLISIVVSMVTNVFLSRVLIELLIKANVFKKPSYYGVKESEIRAL
ncbi:MAG: SecDF [Paenibacillaceae bacterium]|jgi:SecD/SecF fusion protein|nr:SecDF [Paenibacillaceae bacterium]